MEKNKTFNYFWSTFHRGMLYNTNTPYTKLSSGATENFSRGRRSKNSKLLLFDHEQFDKNIQLVTIVLQLI